MLKRCIYVLCLVVIVFLSGSIGNNDYIWADTPETYEYVRMWPTLKNPWYFNYPHGIAVDNSGNVYVADSSNYQIQKFSVDGQFITKWGTGGSGDGQFNYPCAIAVDGNNNVFVADTYNNRIQKFTSNGTFIAKWGSYGSGNGSFEYPQGLAVDSAGNVYVADSDNNRIQKFTSNGTFISKWGSTGTGASQFNSPRGVAVDNAGNVYVADFGNNRIQKFTKDGTFIMQWGQSGSADGQFYSPYGLASDKSGNLYVADSGIVDTTSVPGRITVTGGNHRIQKFTSDGKFITKWGSWGDLDGRFKLPDGVAIDSSGNVFVVESFGARIQRFTSDGVFVAKWACKGAGDITGSDPGGFSNPGGIAFDKDGNVYIAEQFNDRIQVFTPDGRFIKMWGSRGTGDGQMNLADSLVIDDNGTIYVADSDNNRIQKFDSNGNFLKKWGTYGTGDGQFNQGVKVAIDKNRGYIYTVDGNMRVQKFSLDGVFITKWGSKGSLDGQFSSMGGLAVDSAGNVYVPDSDSNRIQKFTSDGKFITKWGSSGSGDGQFNSPNYIALDDSGNVYITDFWNGRVQKFTSDGKFITKWGSSGTNPGQMYTPASMAINKDGYIYVSEYYNYRVQVFKKATSNSNQKAIIVAGSGPYQGNNLWNATEMNTNFAYRALTYQGFKKQNIYYLSFANIDVDNNGLLDDVAGSPSNDNFKYAITSWAKDASDVIIYLTGHGGDGTFRMSENEILKASDLSVWLNTLQAAITGKVIFVYDACYSGSFISQLIPPKGKPRIDITSTSPTEEAVFGSSGSVSFSYYFWGSVFNGYKLYDSYVTAKNAINETYIKQNALIDDDGDGVGGEKTDGDIAKNVTIGNGNSFAADFPIIGSVSQVQTLNGETTAKIRVDNVTSTGSIQRVWAVVTPPDFKPATAGEPVTNLPTFDFNSVGGNAYEGTYGSFTVKGTYNIAVFAVDDKGTLSLPQATSVTQSKGSATDPQSSIMANGANGTVNLKTSDTLSLKVGLNPGSHTNENADWWLYAATTAGSYYFDAKGGRGWTPGYAVAYQGALFNFPSSEVLNIGGLPSGSYTFSFGVDLTMDGKLTNPSYISSVTINVSE
ncbi:MAG: hypothetical protein HQK89_07270 [Nitrospirae bacterium]|nr:hypothetical protein [Nitrospirota bacterium]